jgi:hypothetical protein
MLFYPTSSLGAASVALAAAAEREATATANYVSSLERELRVEPRTPDRSAVTVS